MVIEVEKQRDTIPGEAFDTTGWIPVQARSAEAPDYVLTVSPIFFEGLEVEDNPWHEDWITALLLLTAILYIVVLTYSRTLFSDIVKVVSMGAAGKPVTGSGGIFHWQTTFANLASFINVSLFIYLITINAGVSLPGDAEGFLLWGIIFICVAISITLRHLITAFAGDLSDKRSVFAEYLRNIYILYMLMGIAIMPFVIGAGYLSLETPVMLIKIGVVIIFFIFIIRIISLLNIFMRSGISIFYFILYLCALEIMPAAVVYTLIIA
jgi:hypothetical protein